MNSIFHNRLILVTGASRNIGYHLALQLAQQGARIIATARTIGGLEALDDAITAIPDAIPPVLAPFDLNDGAMIDALGASLYQRFGKLDGLILNAGTLGGSLTPLSHIAPDTWHDTLNLNLTANYRLIRSLEPLLKQTDKALLLALTDHKPHAFWGHYHASKAALQALLTCYAEEQPDMIIGHFTPEPTQSKLRQQAFPGEDKSNLQSASATATQIIEHMQKILLDKKQY